MITSIVTSGLCTGCGTCAGLCPKHAITLTVDPSQGIYLPRVDPSECLQCGICLHVCPGHSVSFREFNWVVNGEELNDTIIGNYLNCYLGYAVDSDVRHNAASGGLVTGLLISAIENGLIDGALVTKMSDERPLKPQPFIARTKADLIASSKSKYCPVPVNMMLREIMEQPGRYAIVGLACHIQGIRKACSVLPELKNRIAFCISLVCGHTDNFYFTQAILKKYCTQTDIEKIKTLDYRGGGWPGFLRISFKNNNFLSIPYDDYIPFHVFGFFAAKRCFNCADSISRLSDVTVMDAWLPEVMANDHEGTSLLIARSVAGKKLCEQAQSSGIVTLNPITGSRLIKSQGKQHLLNKDLPAFFSLSRLFGKQTPHYDLALTPSGPLNWARASLMYFNATLSTKWYLRGYIFPLMSILTKIKLLLKESK